MKVKNISSTTIDLPELGLYLKPGDEGDLSSFKPQELSRHETLTIYFQKGLLVNLGSSSPLNAKKRLNSARDRIGQLKLKDYVQKARSPRMDIKKQLEKVKNTSDPRLDVPKSLQKARRSLNDSESTPEIERYREEYFQNIDPLRSDGEKLSKPRVRIDNSLRHALLDPIEGWKPTKNYQDLNEQSGLIYPEPLVGTTTILSPNMDKSSLQPVITDQQVAEGNRYSLDIEGNKVKIDLDKVEKKLQLKCNSFTKTGKPCSRTKIEGFDTCYQHMTASEKSHYRPRKKILPKDKN